MGWRLIWFCDLIDVELSSKPTEWDGDTAWNNCFKGVFFVLSPLSGMATVVCFASYAYIIDNVLSPLSGMATYPHSETALSSHYTVPSPLRGMETHNHVTLEKPTVYLCVLSPPCGMATATSLHSASGL